MKWLDKYSEDVPKAQSGNSIKKKPIVVSDEDNPRYKAYQDSLSLYKTSLKNMWAEKNISKSKVTKKGFIPFNEFYTFIPGSNLEINDKNYYPGDAKIVNGKIEKINGNKVSTTKKQNLIKNNIEPIGFDVNEWTSKGSNKSTMNYSTIYKKPQEEVIVRKTPLVNPIKIEDEQYTPINSIREVKPVVKTPKKYKIVDTDGEGAWLGGGSTTQTVEGLENVGVNTRSKRTITPIYQFGGNKPSSESIDYDYVNYGTPEYEEAYKQGKFAHATNQLDEIVVTPYDKQYPHYQSLSPQQKKFINDDSPIGRQIRGIATDGVGFNAEKAEKFAMGWLRDLPLSSLQAPQSALVEGVEALRGKDYNFLNALEPDKQRIPSETWGIKNPYAAFAVDAITDPELLTGVGMATSLPRFGKKLGQEIVETNVPIINTTKNLEDLIYAKEWGKEYGYNLPENLQRIAESDELTNRTIRGMMNRHNTFVRGVSTNWEHIEKTNPQILRHIEGKGIDWKNNPKAAAEYMATHVPIQTGYGRADLNNEVFNQGLDGIYTSNSIPTAEGYTYGQGYIIKVKKPTDFSSTNRQDWITKNNPAYYDNFLPSAKEFSPKDLEKVTSKDLDDALVQGRISYEEQLKIKKYFEEVRDYKQQLKKDYRIDDNYVDDGNDKNFDLYLDALNFSKERIAQRVFKEDYANKLLRTERAPTSNSIFHTNKIIDKFLSKKGKNVWTSIEGSPEGEQLYQNIINIQKNNPENNDAVLEYLKQNYPDFDPIDRYSHYIHLGTPGTKLLDPVKSWEITPETWKNTSRAHTNSYSKKLSALSVAPIAPIAGATYMANQQTSSFKNGGVIKDNRGQWVHPGEITEIDSPEITMQGVSYPVLGVSKQTGEQKMMFPEKNYKFANTKSVIEKPISKNWLDKYEDGGELPKAQKGKKIILDERQLGVVNNDNIKPFSLNRKETTPLTKEQIAQRKVAEIKARQGEIKQHTPQSTMSKAKEIALNPMTAFGYVARNEQLPENFSKGNRVGLDYAIDVVNPVQYVEDTKNVVQGAYRGDLGQVGEGLLGVVPMGLEAKNIYKGIKNIPTGIAPELRQGLRTAGPSFGSKFNSEIDWSKWNKEIPENTQLMNEYNAIEQSTKKAGTWMKNPDGSDFKGTPEQFVQQNSSNFKNAFGKTKLIDEQGKPMILHHGHFTDRDFSSFLPSKRSGISNSGYEGDYSFFTPHKSLAEDYAGIGMVDDIPGYKSHVKSVYINTEKPLLDSRTEFADIDIPKSLRDKHDAITASLNPKDFSEVAVPYGNNVKSATGNNGMFDMTNPNIYKTLVPGAIGIGAISQTEFKNGGVIKDDMGYWNPDNVGKTVEIGSGNITMEGVNQPLLGISKQTGEEKIMFPGKNYKFANTKQVVEYPMVGKGWLDKFN